MADLETLTVTLPTEMAGRVMDAVASGDYASPSEVLQAALRAWTISRAAGDEELASLKADIADGLADLEAGRVEDFDADRIAALGRQLLADRARSA